MLPIPAMFAKDVILKLITNPKNILIAALIACSVFFWFKNNHLDKKVLKMNTKIVKIENDVNSLKSVNKKCFSEKDLLVSDQSTMQRIIDGLKRDLIAEQANAEQMVENIRKKYELINNSVSIKADDHIKEGKIVDDKSSEDIIDFINTNIY
jgi:hypothetical protein